MWCEESVTRTVRRSVTVRGRPVRRLIAVDRLASALTSGVLTVTDSPLAARASVIVSAPRPRRASARVAPVTVSPLTAAEQCVT